jgi:hypothetical protein
VACSGLRAVFPEAAARLVLEYGSGYGLKQRSLGIPRLAPCSQHISARTRTLACPPARTRLDLDGFWTSRGPEAREVALGLFEDVW